MPSSPAVALLAPQRLSSASVPAEFACLVEAQWTPPPKAPPKLLLNSADLVDSAAVLACRPGAMKHVPTPDISEPHRSKCRLLVHAHNFFFPLLLILIVFWLPFFSLSFAPTARRAFPHLRGGLFCLFSPPPFLSLFLCATQINAIVSWLAHCLKREPKACQASLL